METLEITGTVSNNLGLLYFDPETETLKELDSSATYLTCKSYSFTIKRFYLTGSLLNYTTTVTLTVNSTDEDLYNCRVIKGSKASILSDFDNSTNELVLSAQDLGVYYTNVIPVDILITSNSSTEKVLHLEIQLIGTVDNVIEFPGNSNI